MGLIAVHAKAGGRASWTPVVVRNGESGVRPLCDQASYKNRDQKVPKDALDGKMTGRLSNRTCDSQRV
jgi:hypothetical protein